MKCIYYLCLDFQFLDPAMVAENQNYEEVKRSVGKSSWTDIIKRRSPKCCRFDGTIWPDKQWDRAFEPST